MVDVRLLADLPDALDSAAANTFLYKTAGGMEFQTLEYSDIVGYPTTGIDSAGIISLIDSAHVKARVTDGFDVINFVDSGINSNITKDSAGVSVKLGNYSKGISNLYLDSSSLITIGTHSFSLASNGEVSFFGGSASSYGISSGSSSAVTVENSSYTTFLLKTDSTQTDAQVDASTNALTITETGNVKSTAFTPYHPAGYSVYFDGTDDYLKVGRLFDGTTLNTFTIECWINYSNATSYIYNGHYIPGLFADSMNISTGESNGPQFGTNPSDQLVLYWWSGSPNTCTSTETVPKNTWTHIAVVCDNNSIQFYINGVAATMNGTTTWSGTTGNLNDCHIGGNYHGNVTGYISDFRVTSTAVYTSDFTPSTERLTAITGTELLTCNLPYIVDGSSNAQTVTVNDDAKSTQSSQFDHVAYSPSSHGGSVYFDGSGDELNISPSASELVFGTDPYTVEFWLYPVSAATGNHHIYGANSQSGFLVYYTGSKIAVNEYNVADKISYAETPELNTWAHYAFVREGTGTNQTKIYKNGKVVATGTDAQNWATNTSWTIGGNPNSAQDYNGHITDLRVVKGTAVYTSEFTPPTEPLTAISGTQLLTCTNKNSIYDAASGDTITLNANATASNTQTKYSDSVAVDGTADGVWVAATGPLDQNVILTTDFTVEFWAYPTAWYDDNTFFSIGRNSNYCPFVMWTGASETNIRFYANSTGSTWNLVSNGDSGIVKWTNSWKHIAMTYDTSATTVKFWVDGTLVSTHTGVDGWENGNAASYWTFATDEASAAGMAGYLEDIRITTGLIRYTSNFTPPTAALEA